MTDGRIVHAGAYRVTGPWCGPSGPPTGRRVVGGARILDAFPIIDRRGAANDPLVPMVVDNPTCTISMHDVSKPFGGEHTNVVEFPVFDRWIPDKHRGRIIVLDSDYVWETDGYTPGRRFLPGRSLRSAAHANRWRWGTEWDPSDLDDECKGTALPSGFPAWPFLAPNSVGSFDHAVGLSIPFRSAAPECVPPAPGPGLDTGMGNGVALGSRWALSDVSYENAIRKLTLPDDDLVLSLLDSLRYYGGFAIDVHSPERELGVMTTVGMISTEQKLVFQRATQHAEWCQVAADG